MKTLTTTYPMVNSLDNLEVGRIYSTTNYKILKPLKGNRGIDAGFVPERVNAFKEMIRSGKFLFGIIHVMLNMKGFAIDGNNKLKALEEMGLPVNFMLFNEPAFNVSNPSDILNAVSDYNSLNSSWFAKDSYLSALLYQESCAVAIEKIKTDIETRFAIVDTMLTPSRIIALVKENKQGLGGKAQPRKEYCDDNSAKIINSDSFLKQMEFIANVINMVKAQNPSITEWFVIRCLMPVVWSEKLDLNVLYAKIQKVGFKKMENEKMSGIRTKVNQILEVKKF